MVPHYPIIDIDNGNTDDFINIRHTKNCQGPIIDIDIGNTDDFLNIILNNIKIVLASYIPMCNSFKIKTNCVTIPLRF